MLLLLLFPMIAFSSLAGMVAAMALLAVENMHTPLQIGVGRVVSLGSASGPITTSVWSLQLGLIIFVKNYKCWLYTAQRSMALNDAARILAFTALIVASSFARTVLPALYVARNFDLEGKGTYYPRRMDTPNDDYIDIQPIILSSLAAAAPMLVSTASPALSWYIMRELRSATKTTLCFILTWLLTAGFDALAGYTFARTIQNQGSYPRARVLVILIYSIGYNFIHPASAATGVGVFGSLIILWPILSCIVFRPCISPFIFWYRRRRSLPSPPTASPSLDNIAELPVSAFK